MDARLIWVKIFRLSYVYTICSRLLSLRKRREQRVNILAFKHIHLAIFILGSYEIRVLLQINILVSKVFFHVYMVINNKVYRNQLGFLFVSMLIFII